MLRRTMTLLALGLALAGGCGGEEELHEDIRESESALAEHEAANEPVDEWRDDGPSADEVPVEADFHEEAEASINDTNYAQALDALEAEIQQ